ncbi:MAG: GtrA family protein [Fimbriimonadaceae bacterium]
MVGYAVVGLTQLAVEWGLFVAATAFLVPVPVANVAARIVGASLGFWLNGRFTFARSGAVLDRRALLRFATSWAALTVIGTAAVTATESVAGLRTAWVAKPVIDVFLAGVGFLASKYWIYGRPRPKGQSSPGDGAIN